MKKKSKSSATKINSGFNDLMGSYIMALQENSDDIAQMLEELTSRKLSVSDKKELNKIQSSLKKMDSDLNSLDKGN